MNKLNKTVESLLDSWDMASFELALALLGLGSYLPLKEARALNDWARGKLKPYGFGFTYSSSNTLKCHYLAKMELHYADIKSQNILEKHYT